MKALMQVTSALDTDRTNKRMTMLVMLLLICFFFVIVCFTLCVRHAWLTCLVPCHTWAPWRCVHNEVLYKSTFTFTFTFTLPVEPQTNSLHPSVPSPAVAETCCSHFSLSYDVWDYQNSSYWKLYKVTLRWAVLTVLLIGFCHTGPVSLCIYSFVFMCSYSVFFELHSAYMSYYCTTVGWTWSVFVHNFLCACVVWIK